MARLSLSYCKFSDWLNSKVRNGDLAAWGCKQQTSEANQYDRIWRLFADPGSDNPGAAWRDAQNQLRTGFSAQNTCTQFLPVSLA
jgi:hypothetical protein